MEYLEVQGGNPLRGEINISGSKNATFPILSAALLVKGRMHFSNVPKILDVLTFTKVLESLGVGVEEDTDGFTLDTSKDISSIKDSHPEEHNLRGTQTLLGALIGRTGEAKLSSLGGCNIGTRPIDLHLKGMQALGVDLKWEEGFLTAKVKDKLQGNLIYLDFPSVGATENIIIASTLAEGETIIQNGAREPEIRDLINFLNACGANIEMNGSGIIKIKGVNALKPADYSIISDRIEAATYLIMGIATRGDVKVRNCNPYYFEPVIMKLKEAGAEVDVYDKEVRGRFRDHIRGINVKTLPFPGFPTDVQPQMMAFLSRAEGTSVIIETIFENRFRVAEELTKMGANIKIEGNTAVITGVSSLNGANVNVPDLRGGAALLIAALSAEGTSRIYDPIHIDRGYENIIEKINKVGGIVERKAESRIL